MELIEFDEIYTEQVKDLLVELQEYIVDLDKFKLNILTPEYREKYLEYTLKELNDYNGKMFLAIENNIVIGLICGYIYKYEDHEKIDYLCPNKGIISELIISKKYRNCGIGQALLVKMEAYFKKNQCKYIQLDVFAYNKNAKKFYEKNNYEDRLIVMSKKI